VIFSYNQVIWILNNVKPLNEGRNPDPKWQEIFSKRAVQAIPHAYFENPWLLVAEVINRAKRCGQDYYVLEERYGLKDSNDPRRPTEPKTALEIANEKHMDIKKVIRIIKNVKRLKMERIL